MCGLASLVLSAAGVRGTMKVPVNGVSELRHICSALSNVFFTVSFDVDLPSYGGLPYTFPMNERIESPLMRIPAFFEKAGFDCSMHRDSNRLYVLRMFENSSLEQPISSMRISSNARGAAQHRDGWPDMCLAFLAAVHMSCALLS